MAKVETAICNNIDCTGKGINYSVSGKILSRQLLCYKVVHNNSKIRINVHENGFNNTDTHTDIVASSSSSSSIEGSPPYRFNLCKHCFALYQSRYYTSKCCYCNCMMMDAGFQVILGVYLCRFCVDAKIITRGPTWSNICGRRFVETAEMSPLKYRRRQTQATENQNPNDLRAVKSVMVSSTITGNINTNTNNTTSFSNNYRKNGWSQSKISKGIIARSKSTYF